MTRRAAALGLLALALAACAGAPPHDVAAERCNPDAAFERGMADGKAGRAEDLAWVESFCAAAVQAGVRSAYQEGLAAGLAAGRAAGDADLPPAGPAGARSERAYFCEVQARGDVFSAYGATRIEADAAARARCRERNGEGFCGEVACRRNE